MDKTTVVVIGGGATGVGVLRDLAMRGVPAVLVEQSDLAHGTSSRFHGLLHSGARYAVKDPDAAVECIGENRILRKIARHAVEETEGLFVRLPEDDPAFEARWLDACRQVGIPAVPLDPRDARCLEPGLTDRAVAVYRVPDAAIDGFRLCWHNAVAAGRHGGQVRTYHEAVAIETAGGRVSGVRIRDTRTGRTGTIACDWVVNAAGSWVGHIAALAGLDVDVRPDRGALLAFNHRFTGRIVNRLRPPDDGDIFVPHGSITILGTTSAPASRPDDTAPTADEIRRLLAIGQALFPDLPSYRLLRAFAGTRPLYGGGAGEGREASRNFVILDHAVDGLDGMASVVGGKLTTYRLMAEKTADLVCRRLGVTAPCRTADEPLVAGPPPAALAAARKHFPACGADLAADRLGDRFATVADAIGSNPEKGQLLCECELVTRAEVEAVAAAATTFTLSDIRRRTRLGMGTCQGAFCGYRGAGLVVAENLVAGQDPIPLIEEFIEARWSGIRPLLWGNQLRDIELTRGIYQATLNIDGEIGHEKQ